MRRGKETDGDANLAVTKQDIRTKLPQNQDLSNSNRKISWQREAPQASVSAPSGIALRNTLQWHVAVSGSTCQVWHCLQGFLLILV